jgi:hypothetical protein
MLPFLQLSVHKRMKRWHTPREGNMRSSHTLPITRRFVTLSGLALLGAILFCQAFWLSSHPRPSSTQLLMFVITVAAVYTCSAWFGLRCTDAVALPMPYLRSLDHGSESDGKKGFLPVSVFDVLFRLASIACSELCMCRILPGRSGRESPVFSLLPAAWKSWSTCSS